MSLAMTWQGITLTSRQLCGCFPYIIQGVYLVSEKKMYWNYSKQNNQQLTSIFHSADLETESYRSVIINMYNEYRQSSVSCQCWIWSHRWCQNIWGYFTVCSSDGAVFQAATTFFFSCVTDSMLQTSASLPQAECCGHVVHGTAEHQQCQLTWPESPCGVCPCKPSQQHRKAGFIPFSLTVATKG